MIDYTWVAWFQELAAKIAENDESDLVDKAKAVDWGRVDVPLLNYGDENIDPISFLYFLAQRNTSLQYKRIFGSVHDVFEISSEPQKDQPIIPRQRRIPRRCSMTRSRSTRICSGVCSRTRRQSVRDPYLSSNLMTSMVLWSFLELALQN